MNWKQNWQLILLKLKKQNGVKGVLNCFLFFFTSTPFIGHELYCAVGEKVFISEKSSLVLVWYLPGRDLMKISYQTAIHIIT